MYSLKVLWKVILTILLSFTGHCFATSVLDWFYGSNSGNKPLPSIEGIVDRPSGQNENGQEAEDFKTLIAVPFEELSHEDKFIREAERISSIASSGLDRCEHKVIMKIQSSCTDMTEEELAKLSITLLNCQSEISGRNQVICTDNMSLKECTSPMDSETWNAYHIINNRARAVCYAMRQQQFRALSEMAVNKLMSSALKQLTNMDNLEELQKELTLLAADTVSSLRRGQQELMGQAGGLQLAQGKVKNTIAANIKQLTLEKTLIQSTHNQLTMLLEKLAKQLETQGLQLKSQKEQQYLALEEVLTSLSLITANTDALWTAIDKKSQHLLQQQEKIKKSNSETLENLKQINMNVLYLSNMVNQMKTEVDTKITWATEFVGGDRALLISVLLNALYLHVGVLVTLFLQLSLRYRLSLLAGVGTNIALVYQHQSLSFLALTVSIISMWVVTLLLPVCWFAFKKYKSNSSKSLHNLQREKVKEEEENDNLSTKSSSKSENASVNYDIPKWDSTFTEYNDNIERINSHSLSGLKMRRSATSDGSQSQSVCAAVCRNGQSCRSTPTPGRRFCRRHLSH